MTAVQPNKDGTAPVRSPITIFFGVVRLQKEVKHFRKENDHFKKWQRHL